LFDIVGKRFKNVPLDVQNVPLDVPGELGTGAEARGQERENSGAIGG